MMGKTAALAILAVAAAEMAGAQPCLIGPPATRSVAGGTTITVPLVSSCPRSVFITETAGLYKSYMGALCDHNEFTFTTPRGSTQTDYTLILTAPGSDGVPGCTASTTIPVTADPELAALADTVYIPVAGSVHGANGSNFKTSLRMEGAGVTGTIYFRPSGTFFGDDRDPHLSFAVGSPGAGESIASVSYDDVVGAMGASGIGALDVRFSGHGGGEAVAAVYNDTPQGRFGSTVLPLTAADLLTPYALSVIGSDENLNRQRINVGLRTFDKPITVTAGLTGPGAFFRVVRVLPPNTFIQLPLAELLGTPLTAGNGVTFTFAGGPISAYTSVTDNGTNDPTIYVPAARRPFDGEAIFRFILP